MQNDEGRVMPNKKLPVPLPLLNPAQELAMAALLAGDKVGMAAERAGVCRQTVGKWIHRDAEFQAELRNRRALAWSALRAKLEARAETAVERISDLLDDPNPWVQIKAATTLLGLLGSLPGPEALQSDEAHAATIGEQLKSRQQRAAIRATLGM